MADTGTSTLRVLCIHSLFRFTDIGVLLSFGSESNLSWVGESCSSLWDFDTTIEVWFFFVGVTSLRSDCGVSIVGEFSVSLHRVKREEALSCESTTSVTASIAGSVCNDISSTASNATLDDSENDELGSIKFSEASLDNNFLLESWRVWLEISLSFSFNSWPPASGSLKE